MTDTKITMKAARVNADYTLEEASELLGITTNMLWRWEQNPENIPIKYKDKIEEVYRMPIDNIVFLNKN